MFLREIKNENKKIIFIMVVTILFFYGSVEPAVSVTRVEGGYEFAVNGHSAFLAKCDALIDESDFYDVYQNGDLYYIAFCFIDHEDDVQTPKVTFFRSEDAGKTLKI